MDELKIIKYLDGEMSGKELSVFEEEIRVNPLLAEEIRKYRQIQDLARNLLGDREGKEQGQDGLLGKDDKESAFLDMDLEPALQEEINEAVRNFKNDPESYADVPPEYREKLHKAGRTFFASRSKTDSIRMIRRIWYSTAAVVVIAVAVSILIFSPFDRMSYGEIYARYFSTFHKTNQIVELARTDNDFLFATEVYEAGDFDRAAVLFEMLADSSEIRAWSLFYAGSSYMSLNRINKAIGLFSIVIDEGDTEVMSQARWQLALCYIRNGNPDEARGQLEILLKDPLWRKDAGRILRILRH